MSTRGSVSSAASLSCTATPAFMSTVPRPQRYGSPSFSMSRVGRLQVDRHGVDVAGDDDALRAPEVRAGDDRVAVAVDVEVRQRTDGRGDRVGESRLVAGDARDVADRAGEVEGGRGQIERGHPPSLSERHSVPAMARRETSSLALTYERLRGTCGATASPRSPQTARSSTRGSRAARRPHPAGSRSRDRPRGPRPARGRRIPAAP